MSPNFGEHFTSELPRTPLGRSSQHSTSRHSGEALSTVPHPPKLGHIGQTVNARGFANATCCTLQPLVARQCPGGDFGIVYCCPTAAKPSIIPLGPSIFLWDLQEKQSADERTRTVDLLQLRVCCRTCEPVLIRPAIWLIYAVIALSGNVCRPLRSALCQPTCGTVAVSFG
jgi:hypothetical protein